jgi:hypothetical protein
VNTIEVRYVYTALVGRRIVLPVLVHIQCKQHNVDSVELLEHNDGLAPKRELLGIILVRVSLLH